MLGSGRDGRCWDEPMAETGQKRSIKAVVGECPILLKSDIQHGRSQCLEFANNCRSRSPPQRLLLAANADFADYFTGRLG